MPNPPEIRCRYSRKCRQPLAFKVSSETWTAYVCLNHLGPLCQTMRTRSALVQRVEVLEGVADDA